MKTATLTLLLLTALNVTASPFAKHSEAHGVLNLHSSQPTKNIFPVTLTEINGENIVSRSAGVWLKPGEYSLRVSAIIPLDLVKNVTSRSINHKTNKNIINVKVEEGKTYYIGYDASERNRKLWKPVVWKVKEL